MVTLNGNKLPFFGSILCQTVPGVNCLSTQQTFYSVSF